MTRSSSGHRRTVFTSFFPRVVATAAAVFVAGFGASRDAHASGPSFGPNDVQTLFFISKSQGKNRVDYGMRLDDQCAPPKRDAVFPYWRKLEESPARTNSLALFERAAYGVDAQRPQSREGTGADYAMRLKHVDRIISISTSRDANGRCVAQARTVIDGVPNAELSSVHVTLSGPLSVAYIDVKGKNPSSGKPIEERIVP